MWILLARLYFILVLPTSALALTPPLGLDQLEASANTIVVGKVWQVVETGRKEESDCWIRTEKVTWVKVIEYLKDTGSTDKEVNIAHWDTQFKQGCVGPHEHRFYKDEKATFYLVCQFVTECRLVHWNGVQPIAESAAR